jgi:hypothetical protein
MFYHRRAEIKNTRSNTLRFMQVTTLFYDESGK